MWYACVFVCVCMCACRCVCVCVCVRGVLAVCFEEVGVVFYVCVIVFPQNKCSSMHYFITSFSYVLKDTAVFWETTCQRC